MEVRNIYQVEYINCRVCGADQTKVLGVRGNQEYWGAPPLQKGEKHMVTNVVKCRICGFFYTCPLILISDEEKPNLLYHDPENYRATGSDPLRFFTQRLSLLEKYCGRKGRLLDVGSGKGEFLAAATKRGWKALGVEISTEFVRYSREKYGVEVWEGTIENAAFLEDSFEAVALNMVLEHVEDPNSLLREIGRVLVDGGVLFIEVPNLESLMLKLIHLYFILRGKNWAPYLSPLHPPYHRYGYSPRTIEYLCRKNGFKIVMMSKGSLIGRGFRNSKKMNRWESLTRLAAMWVGDALGMGDVLTVIAQKIKNGL